MKRIFSVFALFFLCSLLFAQFAQFAQSDGYRGQRNTRSSGECRVTGVSYSSDSGVLDIYFSSAVDPRSVSGSSVFVDNVPVGSGARATFNRDGTQARISIGKRSSFNLKISGVKSYDGKSVPQYSKSF